MTEGLVVGMVAARGVLDVRMRGNDGSGRMDDRSTRLGDWSSRFTDSGKRITDNVQC